MNDPGFPEDRVVREERVVERPRRRRRTIVERGVGDRPGFGLNPLGAIIATALVVFILVLIFGFLL
ncbi:MAG TPA: hypothetical protein VGV93_13655 [Acidimicrobiales bacterium]|nr:hypothetical protein [Acidimicrobiales bacterium]